MSSAALPSIPGPRRERYTATAIALHWLLALAILGSLGVGLYMTGLPMSPAAAQALQLAQVGGRDDPRAVGGCACCGGSTHRPPADLPTPVLATMPPGSASRTTACTA